MCVQHYASITVKVTDETKDRLEKMKIIPEETMNNVLKRLLDIRDKAIKIGLKVTDCKKEDFEDIINQIKEVVNTQIMK